MRRKHEKPPWFHKLLSQVTAIGQLMLAGARTAFTYFIWIDQ